MKSNIYPKILVLTHESYLNGASHSLLNILRGLKERYNFLVVLPEYGPIVHILGEEGLSYKVLQIPKCGYFGKKKIRAYIEEIIKYSNEKNLCILKLEKIISEFQPDIIYTNTSIVSIGYDISKKFKIPHIWHIREYGDDDFGITYIPFKLYVKLKVFRSDAVIFTTKLLRQHWTLNLYDAFVVSNAFSDQQNKRNVYLSKTSTIVIGIVGVVMEVKGQLEALKILKLLLVEYPTCVLNIYGSYEFSDNYFQKLNKFISDNSLNNSVFFKGYVKQDVAYNEIDILLSCSISEAFGRTLIEAMSYGIPVVARNSGGPQELIVDGYDGFLFNTDEEAVEIIINVINKPNLLKTVIVNAGNTFQNRFTLPNMIKSMNKIFDSTLSK